VAFGTALTLARRDSNRLRDSTAQKWRTPWNAGCASQQRRSDVSGNLLLRPASSPLPRCYLHPYRAGQCASPSQPCGRRHSRDSPTPDAQRLRDGDWRFRPGRRY